jgi:hypothetical protein
MHILKVKLAAFVVVALAVTALEILLYIVAAFAATILTERLTNITKGIMIQLNFTLIIIFPH